MSTVLRSRQVWVDDPDTLEGGYYDTQYYEEQVPDAPSSSFLSGMDTEVS